LTLERYIRRVLALQAVCALALAALVVLVTAIVSGPGAVATVGLARAAAAAFGAALGILATLATARSVIKSSRTVAASPHGGLLPVYSGLLWKLLIVAGGAYLGLAHFGMKPLYLMLGYITMQAGYVWAGMKPGGADRAHRSGPK